MKVFLTGITGLVGASFVTAALRKRDDVDIVALCRPGRGVSAEERVVNVIRDQCSFDGYSQDADHILSHIRTVSGDIHDFPTEQIKAMGPFDTFFHCAADVNLGKDLDGKTYETNLQGTVNALKLAHELKVKELQYVSTAYVAGLSNGVVMEGELPQNGFVNSYEKSKSAAEKLVQECDIPHTIYRPSIIVGRLSDGLIRKPLAFYRILEFLGKFKKHYCIKHGLKPSATVDLSLRLQAKMTDRIYFVPIDYVQKAISTLFFKPVQNKCYHITGESPVSTKDIEVAVAAVLKTPKLIVMEKIPDMTKEEAVVCRMIEDLLPYFASRITFDNTQVKADLGAEALAWKQDVEFLKRMATSFYKQTDADLVED